MVKCSRCGVELDDSIELCPNCGNDLSKVVEDKAVMETAQDRVCSKCGLEITDDSDFCPNCGNKLKVVQFNRCSECGSQISENDLICPMCGSKISQSKLCPNCGKPLEGDAEFCDECGQNIGRTKNEVAPIDENLENVAHGTLSILDRIILFFKDLFGGNS